MTRMEEKTKIFIVEDEIFIAADLENCLTKLGYSVCGKSTSAEKALDMLEHIKPDLIMMDIDLQGKMDGIEAAKIINDNWGVPVVFLTVHADDERMEQVKSVHPHGYILKPVIDEQLKVTLKMALFSAERETERNFALEALRANEERFRGIIANMADWIWEIDSAGRYTYCSENVENVLGYTPGEMIGKTPFDFMDSNDAERISQVFQQIVSQKKSAINLESWHLHKTGRRVCLLTNGSPILNENGDVLGYRGVDRDITDRKKSELELKEAYSIINMSPIITFLWKNEEGWPVEFVSENAETIFGYTVQEFRSGKVLYVDAIHPDDLDRVVNEVSHFSKDAANKKIVHKPYRIIAKDGTVKWVDDKTYIRRDKDGTITHYQGIVEDVTERRQSEEALRESEEKYRNIFENAEVGMYRSLLDGSGFLAVNEKLAEVFGYLKEELLAEKSITRWADPKKREEMFRQMRENGYVRDYEVDILTKENLKKTVLASGKIFPDLGYVEGTLIDITDRKAAEAEKEKLQVQLQQARKMEAVGTLAGGIAHDFNNLLQAISGYCQLMLMDKNKNEPDHSMLEAIQKSGDRAAQLVQQLLLFSRKAETERSALILNQELEHTRGILERTIPKMIEIELNLGEDLWTIEADPVQVEQIILNLGGNAADSMPDGGKLIISTENKILNESYAIGRPGAKPGNYVLLTISDTGQGMTKETVEHIFEPFFTTKEIGKGTGLGLASVYGIVKSHGGYIICYSELDLGTTFRIYLPAVDQANAAGPKYLETAPLKKGTETILLVDDEEPIKDVVSQVLSNFDYTVLTASSGEEALRVYADGSNEISLIIMDIGMPGMGGHRCLRELLEIDPAAKVIMASGYSVDGQQQKSLDLGAAGYISKPFHMNALLAKVREILDEEK